MILFPIVMGVLIIFLGIAYGLVTHNMKKSGDLIEPTASIESRITELTHLINQELHEFYSHPTFLPKVARRYGLHVDHIPKGYVNTNDFRMSGTWSMGLVYVIKIHPHRKEDVMRGYFGEIFLNKDRFTSRTLIQRYVPIIAAQLIFLQVCALAGKEPREVNKDHKFMKAGYETILSATGKLEQVSSLRAKYIYELTKRSRKHDHAIADLLGHTEHDTESAQHELDAFSRSIHDELRGKTHIIAPERKKLLILMKKEKHDAEHLENLALQRKKDYERLALNASKQQHSKFVTEARKWTDIAADFRKMVKALNYVIMKEEHWDHKTSDKHRKIMKQPTVPGQVQNDLYDTSLERDPNINQIHAILMSFTNERGRLIALMNREEERL